MRIQSIFKTTRWIGLIGALLAGLAACSTIPDIVRTPPPGDPQLAAAATLADDTRVRWGGTIVAVDNRADESLVEILASELDSRGYPRDPRPGDLRFLARIPGFLDPLIYAPDRRFTVIGTLQGREVRSVGEHAMTLPVVAVEYHYLWRTYRYASAFDDYPYYGYPYFGLHGSWLLGTPHHHHLPFNPRSIERIDSPHL